MERSLKQLQVYCTHKKDGCQWTAELGELDQHLNKRKECPLTTENKEKADEGKARHEASFPTNFSVRSAVATCYTLFPYQECDGWDRDEKDGESLFCFSHIHDFRCANKF